MLASPLGCAVVQLASTTYAGANHTHLTELLKEREGIDLSRPTVRRILTRAGISSPRHRRPPKHRVRRQRMPQAGMLVQIDGSFHRWLDDDGPQFTLLLAVDDATSAVVHAVFGPEEDTRGYFMLMQGRVERAAGTFQDRLVTELRLAGARTIDQANAVLQDFLPRYNLQFAVPAELDELAYRPWHGDRTLDEILCIKHTRKVARDNTVQYNWRTLQLLPSQERPSYAGVQVEVLEHTDGRLQVRHEGEIIPRRSAPTRRGALGASHGALAPTPEIGRIVKRLGNHRVSQTQLRNFVNLEPDPVVEEPAVDNNHGEPPARRELTPRQLALWKAVQQAKAQGLSLRAISRQLGVHRNTVRKYAHSPTQPTNRPINRGASRSD